MSVSPAASFEDSASMVSSVMAPAGTISHTTRGGFSMATSASSEAADFAPFSSMSLRAASAGSKPTIAWPPRIRRCAMLAPMRPRPIIAICIA